MNCATLSTKPAFSGKKPPIETDIEMTAGQSNIGDVMVGHGVWSKIMHATRVLLTNRNTIP